MQRCLYGAVAFAAAFLFAPVDFAGISLPHVVDGFLRPFELRKKRYTLFRIVTTFRPPSHA